MKKALVIGKYVMRESSIAKGSDHCAHRFALSMKGLCLWIEDGETGVARF